MQAWVYSTRQRGLETISRFAKNATAALQSHSRSFPKETGVSNAAALSLCLSLSLRLEERPGPQLGSSLTPFGVGDAGLEKMVFKPRDRARRLRPPATEHTEPKWGKARAPGALPVALRKQTRALWNVGTRKRDAACAKRKSEKVRDLTASAALPLRDDELAEPEVAAPSARLRASPLSPPSASASATKATTYPPKHRRVRFWTLEEKVSRRGRLWKDELATFRSSGLKNRAIKWV